MRVRVGINGFGRIGRDYLRCVLGSADIDVVAINDVADSATLTRLLRYDSTFGPLDHDVEDLGDAIAVGGRKIAVTAQRDPAHLDWGAHAVQVVIESSGRFCSREAAAVHLASGARKVIISAPGTGVDAMIVLGVNDHVYDPARHHVVSNASCTTNCAAPMVKVLHDAFGLEQGFLTSVHAYTNDQDVPDGSHRDARRARSAGVNIIPTTTGAARGVAEAIPDLEGRIDGVALRVPVVDGSLVDLAALLAREVDAGAVNEAFERAAADGPLAGRLSFSTAPLVSTDIIGDASSCVFDSALTQASGRLVKVFGWYDNEWGYTARLADLTRLVAGR